jgi:uncharacterized integral membrane protein
MISHDRKVGMLFWAAGVSLEISAASAVPAGFPNGVGIMFSMISGALITLGALWPILARDHRAQAAKDKKS